MARRLPDTDFANLAYGRDDWRLTVDRAALALPRTPAVLVLGNGFIGLRGPGGGDGAGGARLFLNGVHERVPIPYHEAAYGYARESDTRLPAADPTALAITIDGIALDDWDFAELDLANGRLRSSTMCGNARVTLDRFVAMERNVVAARLTIAARSNVSVSVRARIDPPPFGASPIHDAPYDPRIGPAIAASPWIEIARDAHGRADRLPRSGWTVASSTIGGDTVTVAAGATVMLDLFAAICAAPDRDVQELQDEARALVTTAHEIGFDQLAARQADWFGEFWAAADIDLPDVPGASLALRHGLFQLVQAAGRDGRTSLAAKGQTGEGYEGHVFWDADTYALPVLAHIRPHIARAMLEWRISLLPAARDNARAMGQARGALYPWRTIAGHECSSFFPAGPAQYHINADIAHALELYVAATGDATILAEGGAEMLAETARIWLQIGWHDPRRGAFVINRVTGPDEYSAIVDNNLYTNLMARAHLRFAVAAAGQHLAPGEAEAMTAAADTMLVPFDAERCIPAQDDRFFDLEPWPFEETPADHYPLLIHYHPLTIYRHRVAKQADAVLAAAMLPDAFDRPTRAAMLDAYAAVTVHDSTLSASPFATLAASVGQGDRAFAFWRTSVLTDLADLFGNSDHGLHMAALAGGWNALAFGFAGMQVIGGLRFAPIAVPALGRYRFAIAHRGARLRVAVDDARVCYELLAGDTVTFAHCGEPITLTPAARVAERPLA